MSTQTDPDLDLVRMLVCKLDARVFGTDFRFRVERDNKRPADGRIFVQVTYQGPCNATGEVKEWHGRKWYLSDHMTEDEVVKTCYAAFKATVEHEVMEGFTHLGDRVFNPHANFRFLIDAGKHEVSRDEHAHA